jgi:RNA polymerase sigma factor (TIGR02999 family)
MDTVSKDEVVELLKAWGQGDTAALDRLIPLVYDELKLLARRCLHERSGISLQTTDLIHEAYLRLAHLDHVNWQDRAHFRAMACRIMRGILVDAARARRCQKRFGQLRRAAGSAEIDLERIPDLGPGRTEELLAIHEALERLAAMDPRQALVVEMRFFGGLSVEEAAAVLQISPQSVMRDWKLAKAWLRREVRGRRSSFTD